MVSVITFIIFSYYQHIVISMIMSFMVKNPLFFSLILLYRINLRLIIKSSVSRQLVGSRVRRNICRYLLL